jgi:hypothetical protein
MSDDEFNALVEKLRSKFVTLDGLNSALTSLEAKLSETCTSKYVPKGSFYGSLTTFSAVTILAAILGVWGVVYSFSGTAAKAKLDADVVAADAGVVHINGLIDSLKDMPGVKTISLNSGTTVIPLPTQMDPFLVMIRIDANQYDYRYVLAVAHWGYGKVNGQDHGGLMGDDEDPNDSAIAGGKQCLVVLRAYDKGVALGNRIDYGPPKLEIDKDGNLKVTNSNWPPGVVQLHYGVLVPHAPN